MTMRRATLSLAAWTLLACPLATDAHAQAPNRHVAVLEYRAGSSAVPRIGTRTAALLRAKTSLQVIDEDDARAAKGARVDRAVARCSGQPRCVAGIGRALGADEVLLVGVSELGDVILTFQRVDVTSARVVARVAEALAPGTVPEDGAIVGYLRRVLPRADFVRWGTIEIHANVAGARVEIGGALRGTTPLRPLRVHAPAAYVIAVDKSGYVGFRAEVNVPPDAIVRVEPVLRPSHDAWYDRW